MTPPDVALVLGALLLACAVQSAFGFGLALVAVPVLATRLPFELVTPLLAIVSMALGGTIAWRSRAAVRHELLRPLLASATLGVPLGIVLVTRADEGAVRVALGVLVSLAAFRGLVADLRGEAHRGSRDADGGAAGTAAATVDTEGVGDHIIAEADIERVGSDPADGGFRFGADGDRSRHSPPLGKGPRASSKELPRRLLWPAGIAIGALGGAWNLMGPPLVVLLQRARLAPNAFRATLHAFAFVVNLVVVVLWLASGAPLAPIAAACALALAPLAVGGWLGARLAAGIDTHRYRLAVHLLLLASAATLIASVVGAGAAGR